jgi:carotenoid cleavage dioxygenase-like enzyme
MLQEPSAGLQFPDLLVYRGYHAPSRIEGEVHDCEVIGTIPKALNGAYFRCCGDTRYPPMLGTDIFINGDGMLHAVRFDNGHADLQTRYVRTERFKLERQARRALYGAYRNPYTDSPEVQGKHRGTANTTAFFHHGNLYALKEDSPPMRIAPANLDTLGYWDFNGALKSKTFTAHPKIDPETGECIAFSYNSNGKQSNEVEIYWISKEGQLTRTEVLEAPYSSMLHDFTVSKNYIAFVVSPMIHDDEFMRRGGAYWHWDSSRRTYIVIVPRKEGVKSARWYTSPITGMQTHSFNAWDEGSVLHLDHCVTETGWLSMFPDINDPDAKEKPPFGERWSFDMSNPADTFATARFLKHPCEMPMIDRRFAMKRTRHFWFGTNNPSLGPMLEWGPKGPPFTCLGHYDEAEDRLDFYYAGPNSAPEEPVFVPAGPDAAEGEGWLLSMVGRRSENRTDLVILDALHLSRGPVATVKFPFRLYEGIHGTFVPAEA